MARKARSGYKSREIVEAEYERKLEIERVKRELLEIKLALVGLLNSVLIEEFCDLMLIKNEICRPYSHMGYERGRTFHEV